MSAKVRFVIIALVLAASAFFLWPTWQFYQLDSERKAVLNDSAKLAAWEAENLEDYKDLQESRLKLGLDLRGGVYFTMEVDVPGLLLETAQPDAVDAVFEKVIDETRTEAITSDETVLDIFKAKFDEIARPQGRSLVDYYDFGELGSDINDEDVLAILQNNIDDAVDQAVEVIRQRVDRFGVSEPTIQRQAGRRIIVELPDVTNPEEVRELLATTARLEFKLVRNDGETARLFYQFDKALAGDTSAVKTPAPKTPADSNQTADIDSTDVDDRDTTIAGADSGRPAGDTAGDVAGGDTAGGADTGNPYAGLSEEEQRKRYAQDHPFTSLFAAYFSPSNDDRSQPQLVGFLDPNMPDGEYSFYIAKGDIDKVKALLRRPEIKGLIPEDRQITFSAYPTDPTKPDESPYQLFVVKSDPELTGEVVSNAVQAFDQQNGRPEVQMFMNATGAERWAEVTGANIKKRVAIVLDSAVYSAPVVQSQITGGVSSISGAGDVGEAVLLATILKSGALKAPIRIIEERVVGPSLGEDQIKQGINATLVAALLVILFMAMYYATGGVVADLAVVLNVFITIAILAAMRGTLTLPGIGALVLTIGMAVDANVLIYERIREELALGKTLRSAVQAGYEKAFAAIIDSNITTFMTGIILAAFGTGPIQGFAVMLMIGIAVTLFTAVFITRAVFTFMLERGTNHINFGQPKARTA